MRIARAKRCPFCRSIDGFVERMELSSWQYVCNDCFAHGPEITYTGDNDDRAKAVATRAWNRRDRKKREVTA